MSVGKLPLSVTVSAALHAVAVAWVTAHEVTGHRGDVAIEPAPTLTMVEVVEPARAAADEGAPTTTPVAAVEPARGATRSIATSTGTTTTTATGTEPAPETPSTGTPERHPYFDMRRGTRTDLTLPGTRDDLEHVPAGTTPQKPPPTTTPRTTSDQGSFVAKVDKDGSVTMKDRRDFSIRWAVPTPKLIGRGIAEWYESDKGPDGQRGKQTLVGELSGTVDQPTQGCQGSHDNACSPDRSRTIIVPVFRGGFNPTDWLMRRTVGDPYASKKRAYLDATRDERAQIGATRRTEQLKQTSIIMRRNLERAWASTTDMRARKQLLFELWDEIAESSEENSAAGEASRAARAQVIGFIRAHLPQRGADAFTPEEIVAFNAKKQSTETFAPYE